MSLPTEPDPAQRAALEIACRWPAYDACFVSILAEIIRRHSDRRIAELEAEAADLRRERDAVREELLDQQMRFGARLAAAERLAEAIETQRDYGQGIDPTVTRTLAEWRSLQPKADGA